MTQFARTINVRNVNHALPLALAILRDEGVKVSPRGLETLEYPGPVITTYHFPDEMVLFDTQRDANPFFHFFEAMWILAGRKDVEFLARFNARMREFSDDGVTFHAPYGYRMRHEFGFDQVSKCIQILSKDKDSRQAVISVWNPIADLDVKSRDLPCNDLIMFKVRDDKLRMTVCCRSNDVVWGAYGANAVQFATLQKYIAHSIGVDCGTYSQVSDSFHVYTALPFWKEWLARNPRGVPPPADPYTDDSVICASAVTSPWMSKKDFNAAYTFDKDLITFFGAWDNGNAPDVAYMTRSFEDVALPMLRAHNAYKNGDFTEALREASTVVALDWRAAALAWLQRRAAKVAPL